MEYLADGKDMLLILAISYGGRAEIARATREIATAVICTTLPNRNAQAGSGVPRTRFRTPRSRAKATLIATFV
ncbi:MAG: hypothetical protein IH998_14790 [Proteobacteria bacterium]|nr:hypothetical protein [Pseudomonadota bacterium]